MLIVLCVFSCLVLKTLRERACVSRSVMGEKEGSGGAGGGGLVDPANMAESTEDETGIL